MSQGIGSGTLFGLEHRCYLGRTRNAARIGTYVLLEQEHRYYLDRNIGVLLVLEHAYYLNRNVGTTWTGTLEYYLDRNIGMLLVSQNGEATVLTVDIRDIDCNSTSPSPTGSGGCLLICRMLVC